MTRGFLSLRFSEEAPHIKLFAGYLKASLEKQGHEIFLSAAGAGDNFGKSVGKAMLEMDYIVPLVTLDPPYGQDTGNEYSSYEELSYASEQKKKICVVMMCESIKQLAGKLDTMDDTYAVPWFRKCSSHHC